MLVRAIGIRVHLSKDVVVRTTEKRPHVHVHERTVLFQFADSHVRLQGTSAYIIPCGILVSERRSTIMRFLYLILLIVLKALVTATLPLIALWIALRETGKMAWDLWKTW